MRIIILASLLVAACSSTPLSPHKIDIQQGNFVNQEMVAKLQPGMTRAQVRFVLGTPLVNDAFHSDRWDYVYRYQKAGEVLEQRRVSAVFQGDKLEKVEGDVVPATGLAPEVAGRDARATAGAKAADSRSIAVDTAADTRTRTPVADGSSNAGKPRIPGDVGDIQSAESAPKGKPVAVKRQAAKEEKSMTGKLLGFIGFGDDEVEGEAAPKPTVERLKGPAVARVQTGEKIKAEAGGTQTGESAGSEPKTIAEGIEEDGKLRNRAGKTIGQQLEDKFGFGSGLDSDRPTGPDGQAGASGSAAKAAKGDGKWRNREGKTIMEQVREKFGFGDDESEAEAEDVSAGTKSADKPAEVTGSKDTTARSKGSGGFEFRNREGKTVMEQLREKFSLEGPDEEAREETVRSETVSKSREPELKTGSGTISADNYKPDSSSSSGKSLKDKVLDIFGFD
ncbi:MAG: outer membrane protein assembly factor BamE [Burkholderiales bacterium]